MGSGEPVEIVGFNPGSLVMPRNMSFALTTDQVKDRVKTVTRRNGWWFLKPGDIVNAVKKGVTTPSAKADGFFGGIQNAVSQHKNI